MTREAKIDVRDHPAAYDVWLDPGMQNVAAASELLKPFDARLMRCYPVSTRVITSLTTTRSALHP